MERIRLHLVFGTTVEQVWEHNDWDTPFGSRIRVGRLADGRWYAQRAGRAGSRRDHMNGACVYGPGERGRHYAMATARRWMRSTPGQWRPV